MFAVPRLIKNIKNAMFVISYEFLTLTNVHVKSFLMAYIFIAFFNQW